MSCNVLYTTKHTFFNIKIDNVSCLILEMFIFYICRGRDTQGQEGTADNFQSGNSERAFLKTRQMWS